MLKRKARVQKGLRISEEISEVVEELAQGFGISQNTFVNHCIERCIDEYILNIRGFDDFESPEDFFKALLEEFSKTTKYRGCEYDESREYFLVMSQEVDSGDKYLAIYHYTSYIDIMVKIAFAKADTFEGDNLKTVYKDLIEVSKRAVPRFLDDHCKNKSKVDCCFTDFKTYEGKLPWD